MSKDIFHRNLVIISQILSAETDHNTLKPILKNYDLIWEDVVKVASEHLMLPALFGGLQQKNLLAAIPHDLKDYLAEIHTINNNRNLTLLSEIRYISSLFNDKKINHVFIKGSALLVSTYSDDVGMRMVGDIDILVAKEDIKKAYSLLLKNNYHEANQPKGYKFFIHRHLPRLIPENGMAAVELHHSLISYGKDKLIRIDALLQHKKQVKSIWIPQASHLVEHAIYDHQINDLGYYFNRIHMKNMFDTYSLLKDQFRLLKQYKTLNKYSRHYFGLMTIYYPEITGVMDSYRVKIYKHSLNNYQSRQLIFSILNRLYKIRILLDRFKLFLGNRTYRKFVFDHVINE